MCSKMSLAALTVRTPAWAARTRVAFSAIDTPSTWPPPVAHAWATAAMAVVFPVPAGPTRASRRRREPSTAATAAAWSPSKPYRAMALSITVGSTRRPVVSRAAARSRRSTTNPMLVV